MALHTPHWNHPSASHDFPRQGWSSFVLAALGAALAPTMRSIPWGPWGCRSSLELSSEKLGSLMHWGKVAAGLRPRSVGVSWIMFAISGQRWRAVIRFSMMLRRRRRTSGRLVLAVWLVFSMSTTSWSRSVRFLGMLRSFSGWYFSSSLMSGPQNPM